MIVEQVDEDAGETGKRVYVNFKRVVWHKGFYEILLSIKEYELTGCHVKCADDIFRWLFFFILILSADYEEQCVSPSTNIIYRRKTNNCNHSIIN